jgi:4-diphosphocytidyl-2-C-methyl-D-erythritol kinase
VQDVRLSSRNAKIRFLNPLLHTGGFVKLQAYAKINLFLDVLNKRDDGYHNIFSIMQTVSLCDELTFSFREGHSFAFSIVNDKNLPADETNLVVKAAKVLIDEYDLPQGICIELTKRIPVGAGLAGGSSDCAAVLSGINKLFDLGIPLEKLMETGKSLGADVPFCLVGGTAVTEGIGEKVTPLPPHPPCCIVIACPKIHVSTAEIFARGVQSQEHADLYKKNILDGLSKSDTEKTASSVYNAFTPVTSAIYPQISDIITQFKNHGALGAEMSGTGASVFAYYKDEKTALAALKRVKRAHDTEIFICNPIQGRNEFL